MLSRWAYTRAAIGATLALLALTSTGCGVVSGVETCTSACSSSRRCDEALGVCVVDELARECTAQNAFDVCGVGEACNEETGLCEIDEYVVYVYATNSPTRSVRARQNVQAFIAARVAERFNRANVLSRPVRVEIVRGEADEPGLERVIEPQTLAVLTNRSSDADTVQQELLGRRILGLGQFTNTFEFENLERPWNRYNFGFIPAPRADYATWSHFLENRSTPEFASMLDADGSDFLDPRLPRCSKLGMLYVESTALSFLIQLTRDYMTQARGIEWALLRGLVGDLRFEADEAYEDLEAAGVDCVMVRGLNPTALGDPYADLLRSYEAWFQTKSTTGRRFRWLMINTSRLAEARDEFMENGEVELLEGVVAASYDVGGEFTEQVFREAEGSYEQALLENCGAAGASGCEDWFSAQEIWDGYIPRVAVTEDQMMILLLALAKMEYQSSDASRESARDALVSLLARSVRHTQCDRAGFDSCIDTLRTGRLVHYDGVSSSQVFGDDGRTRTYNETMSFEEYGATGSTTVLETFSHDEMVEILDSGR